MSTKAWKWARAQTGLSSPEKFVLVNLGDFYNEDWERAWPSPARLAEETGLGLSTVKRQLRSLQDKGLVIPEQWMLNDGASWMPNRYLLPLYKPTARPAYMQPVLASVASMHGADFDDLREVPGTGLYIERGALEADAPESHGGYPYGPNGTF